MIINSVRRVRSASLSAAAGFIKICHFIKIFKRSLLTPMSPLQGLCPSKGVGHRDAHFRLEFSLSILLPFTYILMCYIKKHGP